MNATDHSDEPHLFSALLTPHRSLSATGFTVLLMVFGLISFAAGIAFLLIGAWPVFGFFGLDVALVYFAFRINYRQAAAFEEIAVTPSELRVRRVSHRGDEMHWTFNPLWVRLDRQVHEEFGIERLWLVSKGQRLAIGSFLGPDEKDSFSKALNLALNAARRGPDRNPALP